MMIQDLWAALKGARIALDKYEAAAKRGGFELDHLISLELGGSPTSPLNLWPEPHHTASHLGSYVKDALETRLKHMVCAGANSVQITPKMDFGF